MGFYPSQKLFIENEKNFQFLTDDIVTVFDEFKEKIVKTIKKGDGYYTFFNRRHITTELIVYKNINNSVKANCLIYYINKNDY